MGRKSNVSALRRTQWVSPPPAVSPPPPKASPEQRVLRVLYRERERVTARIAVLEEAIQERDRMREQLEHIRDFAEKVMAQVDEKDARLEAQAERIADLEYKLKLLTEADDEPATPADGVTDAAAPQPSNAQSPVPVHRFEKKDEPALEAGEA